VGLTAALCWSSGLSLAAVGCYLQLLPIVYLGYSVLGGAGWGLGYISPIPTLLAWFPDKRGLASGLGLSAFGGGAMLAAPLETWLLKQYFKLPTYLGSPEDLQVITEHGRRFITDENGFLVEVMIAAASDISRLPISIEEGVYLLGTGNTGIAYTFLTLSAGYLLLMATGALLMRVPPPGWTPKGFLAPTSGNVTHHNVHHATALKTPQFYLLWLTLFGNTIAGVTIISTAKTIMTDVFMGTYPLIVTGAFAASYVMALSCSNMLGRLTFGPASDAIGRKRTYAIFGLGIPLTLLLPTLTGMVHASNTLPLSLFCGATVVIISFYGAVFAVLPAYVADTFGQKHVGTIFGRILTGFPVAAMVGPLVLSTLRSRANEAAIKDLTAKCDPALFFDKFGAMPDKLSELVEAKTVTIARLMEILPEGTFDPSVTLYDTTMYTMSAMLTLALAANLMIKPVNPKYYEKEEGDTKFVDAAEAKKIDEAVEEARRENDKAAREELARLTREKEEAIAKVMREAVAPNKSEKE
jgi:MFS family permease